MISEALTFRCPRWPGLEPTVALLEVRDGFHWRIERLLLYLTDTILSFLSPNCINLSLYSSSWDYVLCPSVSFAEILTLFTLFFCDNWGRIGHVIKSSLLFGKMKWNAILCRYIYFFKNAWMACGSSVLLLDLICSLELEMPFVESI